jgi:hypothetical protein
MTAKEEDEEEEYYEFEEGMRGKVLQNTDLEMTGNFKDTTMPLDYFLWLTVGVPWTFAALADPNKIKVEIVPGSGRYRIVDKKKKEERKKKYFRDFIDRS